MTQTEFRFKAGDKVRRLSRGGVEDWGVVPDGVYTVARDTSHLARSLYLDESKKYTFNPDQFRVLGRHEGEYDPNHRGELDPDAWDRATHQLKDRARHLLHTGVE